ncbi:MAG: hypothetical protein NTY36_00620 [Deltaproteobacteria bacterium]|nr:hypothetical protein [Deltaproteobacteria bacterium]
MGRGLSGLQKDILRLAQDSQGIRVRDLLEKLWGWPAQPWKDGQVFDKATIGAQEYNRGHATLSRTIERLRQRSLIRIFKDVTRYGTMISLTSAGIEAAQGLRKNFR